MLSCCFLSRTVLWGTTSPWRSLVLAGCGPAALGRPQTGGSFAGGAAAAGLFTAREGTRGLPEKAFFCTATHGDSRILLRGSREQQLALQGSAAPQQDDWRAWTAGWVPRAARRPWGSHGYFFWRERTGSLQRERTSWRRGCSGRTAGKGVRG